MPLPPACPQDLMSSRTTSFAQFSISRWLFLRGFLFCFLAWSYSTSGVSSWWPRLPPSCTRYGSTWPKDHQRGPRRADPFPDLSSWGLLCRADMIFWWQPISEYKDSKKYDYIDALLPTLDPNWVIKDILADGAMQVSTYGVRWDESSLAAMVIKMIVHGCDLM